MAPGQGLASAMMSIGDDVSTFSNAEANRQAQFDIAKLREQKDRDIAELSNAVKLLTSGGGGRGGSHPIGESAGLPAYIAGGGDPEIYGEVGKYARTGKAPTVTAPTVVPDDYGSPIALDRTSVQVDETRLAAMKKMLPAWSNAELAKLVSPQSFDQFQKGLTEATVRSAAFAPNANLAEVNRRVGATKGEGEFGGDTNVTRNKFTGATADTPMSESQREYNKSRGDAAEARAARPPGGGKNSPDYKAAEAIFKAAERDQEKAEADLREIEKSERDAFQTEASRRTIAEQRARVSTALAGARRRAAEANTRMERIANGDPGRAPVGPVANDPLGLRKK